ncbi:MAG: nitroreductase family protein [Alphaproteobacteria bacterium]|nr:nitroreductase family protein [Alphaproteobacteria bacterium]
MPSRRHVLSLLSAAPFAPALTGCAADNLPDAVAGWRDPGAGETDPRRFALAHAILAPNPHNTQPWLVELDDADGMTLYCDLDRRIPFTDPLDRQITIGHGCFLELYRMAAGLRNYWPSIEFFPEGEPTPRLDARAVARVTLGPQQAQPNTDPSTLQIVNRHTNRNPYETRVPTAEALDELVNGVVGMGEEYTGGVYWTNDEARVAQGRDLVWRGWDREQRTEGAAAETFGWLRFGRREIAEHRDGLGMSGMGIEIFKMLGQLNREQLIDPDSSANKTAAKNWREMAMTSPAFLWITSNGDTPSMRLNAGRAYARLALAAQDMGLAIHPWSQTLEEYEEMADLRAEMREFLAPPEGETVQMLVRIGYAEQVAPSARRDAQDFIRA